MLDLRREHERPVERGVARGRVHRVRRVVLARVLGRRLRQDAVDGLALGKGLQEGLLTWRREDVV